MSPSHFVDVVSFHDSPFTCDLPSSEKSRRQRVISRCVDEGLSAIYKCVRPVVCALLESLPSPVWPDRLGRQAIMAHDGARVVSFQGRAHSRVDRVARYSCMPCS